MKRDRIDIIGLTRLPAAADSPSQPDAYSRLSALARKLLDEFIAKCEHSPELVTALDSMLDLARER
jgi:hypothetical protein